MRLSFETLPFQCIDFKIITNFVGYTALIPSFRDTPPQTDTCAYSVLSPLSISLPLFKKPKDSQSNCSQILLSATCCRLPKQTAFQFSNSEVFITVSVRSESCYTRSWVQWERRSIPGINSTSSTPWHNRGTGKITGQVHCFNISVPSYYKARQCSGCPGKKKKNNTKTPSWHQNPPRVCSAKLGRELTREENPMISVSSSEANLELLSNGNVWSSSLGNRENSRTRKERQGS